MTLRQALHEYLRDTVNMPVYEGRLPIRPMMPALLQNFISATSTQTHSGPTTLLERRVQIDAFANNDAEVDRTATALLHALDGFHGPLNSIDVGSIFLISDFDMGPEEIRGGEVRYRRTLDFSVAYQEVALDTWQSNQSS